MSKRKEIAFGKSFDRLLEEKEMEVTLESLESEQAEFVQEDKKPGVTLEKDDVEIFASFIQESQDHLENIEEKILTLESGYDAGVVDDIFRSMHTMKGTSSFFGLEKVKVLSHALESILDDLRSGKIKVTPELVDILLAGTDLLVKMIEELNEAASRFSESAGQVHIPVSLIDIDPVLFRIDEIRGKRHPSEMEKESKDPESVTPELVTLELVESFVSEAQDLLGQAEKDFLALEEKPADKEVLDDAFRAIHTLKGNAGFLGLDQFEKICMDMESNLDAIRNGKKRVSKKSITVLLSTLDSMQRQVDTLLKPVEEKDPQGSQQYKPIGEILVDLGETSTNAVEEALDKQDRKLGEILVSEGKVSEQALGRALQTQQSAAGQGASTGNHVERKDIRVDMGKLDKLFDLMGELITAESMVIHNPEVKALELESFDRAAAYLSKITREMQEITMTVRMIPLDGLFNKMRRLVRDLSRKFDKNINLVINGQETEMDRNVIEEISDPLIHIIRNAIDHGIEAQGTVSLSAKYEGNEIWVTVRDNGRGLDREKILNKAEEKGLLKGDPESMSDEEVWLFLFEPGFSTAEQVSEVSGRGVGMDVVRRNIEKLRGKIAIESTRGEGMELTLKIPLTLAIIDGITTQVGSVHYAIPMGDILEFHKVSSSQITRTDTQREVLRIRDELVPVIKLFEFFKTDTEKTETADGLLIITQSNGRKAGLLVDDILGYQQIVVKALPDYLVNMRAISGCSIMGNGDVNLIIDTGSLLKQELN